MIESIFIFSIVWTIGACLDNCSRLLFDTFLRDLVNSKGTLMKDKYGLLIDIPVYNSKYKFNIPDKGIVYDYQLDDACKWVPWTQGLQSLSISCDEQIHRIIVPTADTKRNAYFIEVLSSDRKHILFAGETGTGKTVCVDSMINNFFDKNYYTSISFAFSAQTTANQTQEIIDGKLDKRRKGTYGPPLGKICIVFVDDLNMPLKEEYGAQPPIEILRQWMSNSGWYDRKTCEFRELVDLLFIGCMGPPGGGRNYITARYTRHFNMIFLTPFDNDSLYRIFNTLLSAFLQPFQSSVNQVCSNIVKGTIDVFTLAQKELLPTPNKSHYTFNLRDLAKVVQGICLCRTSSLLCSEDVTKVWAHECLRVFGDRLVSINDNIWFKDKLKNIMYSNFKKKWDALIGDRTLIFGDFIDHRQPYYQEVYDLDVLQQRMATFLTEYNSINQRKQMDLVMFLNASEHVSRIVRVMRLPQGNSLLVGVGGSGRKSLSTLSTFICSYELFQIEISKNYSHNEWRDDLKQLLIKCGGKQKEMAFLMNDNQIVNETFLEDISALLNTGEIPNLFNQEDKNSIIDLCMKAASQANPPRHGPAEVMNYFLDICRSNLHVVLCMSPIGDSFRRRLRMFPSLVNCSTLDWFLEWPPDALKSVAERFLTDELNAGNIPSKEILEAVADTCVDMQISVTEITKVFLLEEKRHYYVTPTSYLQLIFSFKALLANKRNEVRTQKSRYDVGLEKLVSTAENVVTMQKTLEDLQPVLRRTSEETAALMVTIDAEQKDASAQQAKVAVEEETCSKQAAAAAFIKDQCQLELKKALPILQGAEDALRKLSKNDLVEVKAMKSPPPGVVLVMTALCIMFKIKPAKKKAPDGRTNVEDYWEPAKKDLLGDPKLLSKLFGYDKENIPLEVVQKVSPFASDPEFDPAVIQKASVAATGLCKWVLAMITYDQVAKEVAPKRKALAEAESTLKKAQDDLDGKKALLQAVVDRVNGLISNFEKARQKKDSLQQQDDDCRKKLVRAEKLTSGLGGEKENWRKMAEKLGVINIYIYIYIYIYILMTPSFSAIFLQFSFSPPSPLVSFSALTSFFLQSSSCCCRLSFFCLAFSKFEIKPLTLSTTACSSAFLPSRSSCAFFSVLSASASAFRLGATSFAT
eukprot:GHVR01150602.1.p1 GENE.GHVR01150602.1~~GHVR01150602.1.p1  ORF type:complete len:1144 (-),score=284.16 GHVR01150602.1:1104-4535(-)